MNRLVGWFEELRRRDVFRAATFYSAGAWLVVEVLTQLVPVFGMGASAIWLGESLPPWKLLAAGLVMSGLAINIFWPTLQRRLARA